MKQQPDSVFSIMVFAAALTLSACANLMPSSKAPQAPAATADQGPTFNIMASGVQIYECSKVDDSASKFEWVFKAPKADLYDEGGNRIGRYDAGPTWESYDGSKVVGAVKDRYPGPEVTPTPLLVRSGFNAGKGVFAQTESITLLDTKGGQAPTAPCTSAEAGKVSRIPYTAIYKFSVASVKAPTPQALTPQAPTPQEPAHPMVHSVMPFDMAMTMHLFKMTESGGVERVFVKDRGAADQVNLLQQHVREEADRFQHGDYSDHATRHGAEMPGLKELQLGAQRVKVSYTALADGAEITFETADMHLVSAIHRWFGAQLSERGANAKAE